MAYGLTAVAPARAAPAAGSGTPQSTAGYKPAACAIPVPASERKGDAPYATCDLVGATDSHGNLPTGSSAPPATALTPNDLRAAYHLPSGGSGEAVAIVDSGGYATAEADLAVFRTTYGIPACTAANGCFTKLDQTGGHNLPPEDAGWSKETALDLDAVSAGCPACRILLVEADSPSADDLGQAASYHPVAISNSYGVPGEFPGAAAYNHYYDHPASPSPPPPATSPTS